MRGILLMGLGLWLGGCVAEPAPTPTPNDEAAHEEVGDPSTADLAGGTGDKRVVLGNTHQALLPEQRVDQRPPPQPWDPPTPPTPPTPSTPEDGKTPDPK